MDDQSLAQGHRTRAIGELDEVAREVPCAVDRNAGPVRHHRSVADGEETRVHALVERDRRGSVTVDARVNSDELSSTNHALEVVLGDPECWKLSSGDDAEVSGEVRGEQWVHNQMKDIANRVSENVESNSDALRIKIRLALQPEWVPWRRWY